WKAGSSADAVRQIGPLSRDPLQRLARLGQRRIAGDRRLIFGASRGEIASAFSQTSELEMRGGEVWIELHGLAIRAFCAVGLSRCARNLTARQPPIERGRLDSQAFGHAARCGIELLRVGQ